MTKLIMVYNADSGYFNAVTDAMHKIFSPATYACNLCAITYGAVSMKSDWQSFIDGLGIPVEFLHRDEFESRHAGVDVALPAILIQIDDETPELLVPAPDVDKAKTIADLQELIKNALATASS